MRILGVQESCSIIYIYKKIGVQFNIFEIVYFKFGLIFIPWTFLLQPKATMTPNNVSMNV